jgi:nucleoside-diphosphate-sugar epimerase
MDEFDHDLKKSIQGVIYLSSTGVYGGQRGESVSEASLLKPYDERGRARLQCEQEWQKSGIRTAILRLSAIYGDDKGLIQVLKAGNYRLVRGRWSNRIHVDDIVAVIVKLLHSDISLWPAVMSVSDDEPTLIDEVVQYYCTELNMQTPSVVPATESLSGFDRSNQKIDNSLLKKFMGQQLKYPNYKSILFRNK